MKGGLCATPMGPYDTCLDPVWGKGRRFAIHAPLAMLPAAHFALPVSPMKADGVLTGSAGIDGELSR